VSEEGISLGYTVGGGLANRIRHWQIGFADATPLKCPHMENLRMHLRQLGPFQVAPIALGGNVFGWTIDEPTSYAVLDAFIESGYNLIDTADVYSRWAAGNSGGESETILGRWLKKTGARKNVVIATKCGMEMGPDQKGLSAKYIRQAVERSLDRLQIDSIDLYQMHKDDLETPQEETLGVLGELIASGKVKAVGASNYTSGRLQSALRLADGGNYPRFVSLQPHYNLCERPVYEDELEPLCRRENLAVFPYYALASGFLTGKYRSTADTAGKTRGARAESYLNAKGMAILAALDEVARSLNSSPAQVALAWLIHRRGITAPIASATSVKQWQELAQAGHLQLTQAMIAQLDAASA
jgi:aryl-alcohol dehydrogenase-like predicted oxidoreductase